MRLLALEPYFGGSHARFLDDLTRHMPFDVDSLTLPARKWKWRMRSAALHFADLAAKRTASGIAYDGIIASTFLDLAVFRSLAPRAIGGLPALVYWHENQFAYPSRRDDEKDFAFRFANVTTALSATRNLFNSEYNLESFLAGASSLLGGAPDIDLAWTIGRIRERSCVLPVPLDLEREPPHAAPRPHGPPIVLWNHRWEHDKNPDEFFTTLFRLAEGGLAFGVAVVGEAFRDWPAIFDVAKERLKDRIVAWGRLESRSDYLALLRRCHVVVSTAHHEFQGLSVIEAALQGAWPLVPNRLSYPEFFPKTHVYRDPEDLAMRLESLLCGMPAPDHGLIERLSRLSWSTLSAAYRAELEKLGHPSAPA